MKFLASDSEVPRSIPDLARFSDFLNVERGPLSLERITEKLLE
jgi:hypothetical protein